MGDDVICIDSDDDDEDDASAPGRTQPAGARVGSRRASGRGYWQQRRRAQRERRKRVPGGPDDSPLAALLDGLRRLSSEMSVGAAASFSVAQRVHRLVGEFERSSGTAASAAAADRQEGWRQVLRFLLVLRAVGGLRTEDRDKQTDTGEVERQPNINNERRQSCHRFQLTVIDILVDYIRFRCETVTGRTPPPTPGVLLQECNRIVAHLLVIFDGSVELATLTLLRTAPEQPRCYTVLLYPVFEAILTGGSEKTAASGGGGCIPSYVRLLLCFKRWRSLVTGRADKAVIDARAGQFLPARCPSVRVASDVPLLRLLPPVPPAQRANETRFLLANDLFSLDQCIALFFRLHRRATAAADERQLSSIPARPTATMAVRLTPMELGSHYINVALLAELIERKGRLWCRALPAPLGTRGANEEEQTPPDRCLLAREACSIVDSLRLIFHQRTEFIELTLLRVPAIPEHAPLLGPLFAAFLETTAAAQRSPTSTATGLAIYRTNDVETYGRLVLCYAKWKALYRRVPTVGEPDPPEWARIDTLALVQLPFDCPRVLCPRDARLRDIFITRRRPVPSGGAGVLAPADGTQRTVTGMLLRTLPCRADLQELCLAFSEAYRGAVQGEEPRARPRSENSLLACSDAYKSMSTLIDRTDRERQGADIRPSASPSPALLAQEALRPRMVAEMKPITIPDSDDGDETSACDTFPKSDQRTALPLPPATSLSLTLLATGSGDAERSNRNTSDAATMAGESVADVAGPVSSGWPPLVECLLNTPPATPQQEVATEPGEEDHRRGSLPVKKPLPCRLKGTVRSIGRRKKRTTAGMRRALERMFDGAGAEGGCWWSFADVLAVRIPFALDVRWFSSIIKVQMASVDSCAVSHRLPPDGRLLRQEATATGSNPQEPLAGARPPMQDDALLLELIGCLDAPDIGSPSSFDWTPSDCVDFAIPQDNPGRADRSRSSAVDDQASPSAFGGPLDASPLFASGSDRFVHLQTALGPASWPIA